MIKKNKTLHITILVFAAAFMWELFFTYGFDFFWEDFAFYHLDKIEHPLNPAVSERASSGLRILSDFFKEMFRFKRLFQAGFGNNFTDRPYQFLTNELLSVIFFDKAILYRIFKALVFACNTCFLFFLMKRTSLKLALMGVLLYITSSEVWVVVAYSSDVAVYAQFAVLVSILLFLHLSEKKSIQKNRLWLYYLIILLLSNYAVLAKCDGRYLAVLFIVTFICFRIKEFKIHAPMFTGLLFLQVPVLGYIKKVFTGLPASPIHIASHNTRSILESLKAIISNDKYPKNALGRSLLILLGIIIVLHLLNMIFNKNKRYFIKEESNDKNLKVRTFLFMSWFVFSFIMIALSRSFSYSGPYDWAVMEESFFIGPFIVFLCYYSFMVAGRFRKPFQTIFITFCLVVMLGQLVVNVRRINQFRGGWGNYFCAWKNVEKYVDSKSNHAIIFTATEMFYKPFVFRHSNNICRNNVPGAQNLEFIEKMFTEEGYRDVFLAERFRLEVEGASEKVALKETRVIDGDSGDLYDRFKRFIGRPSRPVIYVHHYIYEQ